MIPISQPATHFEYVSQEAKDWANWIASVKHNATEIMNQLQGWCTDEKMSVLIDLIVKTRPEVIVEIGVYGGKSLLPMAYVLYALENGKAYGIDPWEETASLEGVTEESNQNFWSHVDYELFYHRLLSQIESFNLQDHLTLIRATSLEAPPIENIGLLHIDGNHTSDASYTDVNKWVPLVKKGGWIILDDIGWHESGKDTSKRTVDWLDEHCQKIAFLKGQSNWGIWVKI